MNDTAQDVRPNRRHVLVGLGFGFIATAAEGAQATADLLQPAIPTGRNGVANLQRAEAGVWARFVGQDFTIPGRSGAVLRLVSVEPAPSGGNRPARVRTQNFHAIFESVGRAVPDGDSTYVMRSPSVQPMPLFLGKRTLAGGRHRLVATFS